MDLSTKTHTLKPPPPAPSVSSSKEPAKASVASHLLTLASVASDHSVDTPLKDFQASKRKLETMEATKNTPPKKTYRRPAQVQNDRARQIQMTNKEKEGMKICTTLIKAHREAPPNCKKQFCSEAAIIHPVKNQTAPFAMNEKAGMNEVEFEKYITKAILPLDPGVEDQPRKRVILKVGSGPGRMNVGMLARLKALGVYLNPGVPNTTHVTQENVELKGTAAGGADQANNGSSSSFE